jgi:hypothetical protein
METPMRPNLKAATGRRKSHVVNEIGPEDSTVTFRRPAVLFSPLEIAIHVTRTGPGMIRTAVAATLLVALLAFVARPLAYDRRPRNGFEATVTGATRATLSGRAVIGVSPGEGTGRVSLELEAHEDGSTLLLHWSFASFPRSAVYGSGGAGAPVLHAYFAPGTGQDHGAVFRGDRGTIRIRHAAPDLVTGTFELLATAPIRGSARPDTMGVRIAGSFVATTVSP